MSLWKKIRKNYLLDLFLSLKGNPRACIWLEPLWGVPYNLYVPFAALYMNCMGLTAYDIGIVTSFYYVSQAISSVLSGVITDKLGRRLTTLICDVLSWSVPTFLWMCADGLGWFIVAAVFNGLWRITDNSWGLLLVEDAERDKIVHMYSLTSVMGLIAAFVAPLSALAVRNFGVVPTMRVLYGFTCLSMTTKFVTLYFLSHETQVGLRRLQATRGKSVFTSLWECKDVFLGIMREKRMVLTVGILAAFSLVNALNENYFAIFLHTRLAIAESDMPLFTMAKSFVRLICLFGMARWLQSTPFKYPMIVAWAMFMGGQIALLLNPGGAWAIPVTFFEVCLEAVALAILYPMTSSLLFINADVEERARINGLVYATIALTTAVFPAIIGYFANISLVIPFVVGIAVYVGAIVMTLAIAGLPTNSTETEQDGL